MRLRNLFVLLVPVIGFASPAATQPELLDRIIAVVGDRIILSSEVDEEVYLAGVRGQLDSNDSEAVAAYRSQVLEAMIEEKVLVEKAESEGLRATREEVDESVERMLGDLEARFPSQAAFEEQLTLEGTTLDELRAEYRERVQGQLIVRRLMDREVRSRVTVENAEIEQYWAENREAIGRIPARLKLSRILLKFSEFAAVDDAALERAGLVLERLEAGEDFATLATVFSEGPTASRGGDLGWFEADDLATNLADAVRQLSVGEITEVVTTPRGAHILKLEEKRDEKLHLRQIVFLHDETASRTGVRAKAESILAALQEGGDFEELARAESHDTLSKEQGGFLGEVPLEALSEQYRASLESLEPGQISEILEDSEGLSIFRLDGKEGEKDPTLEDVRDRIRSVIEQTKAQELYTKYVDEVRESTYIENRLHSES